MIVCNCKKLKHWTCGLLYGRAFHLQLLSNSKNTHMFEIFRYFLPSLLLWRLRKKVRCKQTRKARREAWAALYLCSPVISNYITTAVAGFPLRRPRFDSGSGHVGFVVDKVHWGRFSLSTSVPLPN
jgi:hypothetical protein